MSGQPEDTTAAASLSEASDVVHQRSRLSILAVLYEVGEADFVELRGITRLKDGNLSTHLQVLEEAKLINIRKGFVGKRARTAVSLNAKGRAAFEEEIRILRNLVSAADTAGGSRKGDRRASRAAVRGAAAEVI